MVMIYFHHSFLWKGGPIVRCLDIRLSAIDDVSTLVNLANRFPFYIALRQGKALVDAKSLLGVLSLDITKPITVEIYADNPTELLDALEKYSN